MSPEPKKIHVLIVEDDLDQALSLKLALETDKDVIYTTESAQTLESAVVRLQRDPNIDVVLLDFHLPDGSRGELIDKIKGAAQNVKVIVMTGWDNCKAEAESHGADDFLVKPVPVPELSKRLQIQAIYKKSEAYWRHVHKSLKNVAVKLKEAVDPSTPAPVEAPEMPEPPKEGPR